MKRLAKQLLYYGGWYHLVQWARNGRPRRLLIVMYHDLSEKPLAGARAALLSGLPCRESFAAQLDAMARNYRVMTVEDALTEIDHQGELAEDTVAITIDDGYESSWSIAFDELSKRKMPATIFLITDWINGWLQPWWLHLIDLISEAPLEGVRADDIASILGVRLTDLSGQPNDSVAWRTHLFRHAERSLRLADGATCEQRLNDLEALLRPAHPRKRYQPLTWEQVRIMDKAGIRFGAHTCSHPNFEAMSIDAITSELVCSRKEIAEQITQPVSGFAFPYGTDLPTYRRLEELFRVHQFQYALTAFHGVFEPQYDRYLIGRMTLPADTSQALLGRALCLSMNRSTRKLPFRSKPVQETSGGAR